MGLTACHIYSKLDYCRFPSPPKQLSQAEQAGPPFRDLNRFYLAPDPHQPLIGLCIRPRASPSLPRQLIFVILLVVWCGNYSWYCLNSMLACFCICFMVLLWLFIPVPVALLDYRDFTNSQYTPLANVQCHLLISMPVSPAAPLPVLPARHLACLLASCASKPTATFLVTSRTQPVTPITPPVFVLPCHYRC